MLQTSLEKLQDCKSYRFLALYHKYILLEAIFYPENLNVKHTKKVMHIWLEQTIY